MGSIPELLSELRREVDAVEPWSAYVHLPQPCYLCRRTWEACGEVGPRDGFWICLRCKVASPSEREARKAKKISEQHHQTT